MRPNECASSLTRQVNLFKPLAATMGQPSPPRWGNPSTSMVAIASRTQWSHSVATTCCAPPPVPFPTTLLSCRSLAYSPTPTLPAAVRLGRQSTHNPHRVHTTHNCRRFCSAGSRDCLHRRYAACSACTSSCFCSSSLFSSLCFTCLLSLLSIHLLPSPHVCWDSFCRAC